MKVAYVTQHDPQDIKKWSGSVYYMAKSLENQDITLHNVAPLIERHGSIYKLKQLLYQRIVRKNYLRSREIGILKAYAQQASHKLSKLDYHAVLSPSTLPIAYLDCKQPIAFWTDATFAGMINFYPKFTDLCQESLRNGHMVERLALNKCHLAIYSSHWAAKTAIDFYQVDPNKVKVVPFGANIKCDRTLDDIKQILQAKPTNRCKLLFLGVDWHRKGGPIALSVAEELNRQGLPTELTVVGCQPDIQQPFPKFVKSLGFISKSDPQGVNQIDQLLSEAHFLIMPSRAECYGVVFCEASSFGLPCISTDIGGISTAVQNNLNGRVFPVDAAISDYCSYIMDLFLNYSEYEKLAVSSFHTYQSCLNWSVAGATVKSMLADL